MSREVRENCVCYNRICTCGNSEKFTVTEKLCFQCGAIAYFTHRLDVGSGGEHLLYACANHIAGVKSIYVPYREAEEMKKKAEIQRSQEMNGQILKTGEKKDEGKARFELLPYEVIAAVARILTAGAKKYADRNWEKGISYGRVFGAAQRHLSDFWNAKLNDKDGINHVDGVESHIDHAICELMFISAYEKRGLKQFDDRPAK